MLLIKLLPRDMATEEKAPGLAAPVDIGYPDCSKASIPSNSPRSYDPSMSGMLGEQLFDTVEK